MDNNIRPGRYRHYKGEVYWVVGIAQHSETLEDMVIYHALSNKRKLWVRPASMWNEWVEYNGTKVRRFTRFAADPQEI